MSDGIQDAWNQISAAYQERHQIPTRSAHYGPWAPLESELRLLGAVDGLRILEVGCGGGQCSIAFAREGAQVCGLDLSEAQLSHARALADAEGVSVRWVHGTAEDLSEFETASFDIVFSAYAFQYVEHMDRCLKECARVLAPGGRLAFSLDHPFRDCFLDEEEDSTAIYPVRSYFDSSPMRWTFADTGVPFVSWHRTFDEWITLLSNAGFVLLRLLEPSAPDDLMDDIWPMDDALASMRHIPTTVIMLARSGVKASAKD